MKTIDRSFKGIWIPKDIWLDTSLGWTEKILLVEIDSLDNEVGCYAGNEYFADFFGLSKGRISKLICGLKQKGYLDVQLIYKKDTKQVEKRIIKIKHTYSHKQLGGIVENNHTPMVENDQENNTLFNNTNTIYTFWNDKGIIEHRKLTSKMKSKIKSTLKDYSLEQILNAIENYSEIILNEKYWFTHKWTLEDFLQRGMSKFENKDITIQNYLRKGKIETNDNEQNQNWRGTDRRL